jgi:hypothetical protein
LETRLVAYYWILVGALMVVQWLFFLATGNVPELETEPLAIAFHIAAELATAVVLLAAGVSLLRRLWWAQPASLLGAGMLIYTAINSAGYFAEQGLWGMVAMFGVLLALTVLCVRALVPDPPPGIPGGALGA